MKKILWVGDPHVQVSNLEESESLLSFIQDTANKNEVNSIIFLGDLFHNFCLKRVEVEYFWGKWLRMLGQIEGLDTWVLVGNHDKTNQSNDLDLSNAITFVNSDTNIHYSLIQYPVYDGHFIGYIPYIHDKEKFIEHANRLVEQGAKLIVCHAEFNGAKFESGLFIPEGIDPDRIKANLIISGHIHSKQRFGKVVYPGSPRWLTSSDANEEKGLWMTVHDVGTGAILAEKFFDTSSVCTPIYKIQYKEGDEEPQVNPNSRTAIEFVGSSEWVSKQKVKFKGKVSISSKITDKQKPVNRGTGNNLEHFLTNIFELTDGINKEKLQSFMRDMGIL